MGYRSEVSTMYVFPTKEQRDTWWADVLMTYGNSTEDMDTLKELQKGNAGEDYWIYSMYEDHIKWYGGWEVVFESIRELTVQHGGAWVFCRVGEEHDDIEYDYGYHQDFDYFVPYEFVQSVTTISMECEITPED